ncbi:hypothetical protein niasHT_013286 [Heterodera trifolii]|uniref:Uncharacterized protein n=1 Tax=Heterodera trifolii TaxID=157864 RepID=A0ABD2LAK8_9BILA
MEAGSKPRRPRRHAEPQKQKTMLQRANSKMSSFFGYLEIRISPFTARRANQRLNNGQQTPKEGDILFVEEEAENHGFTACNMSNLDEDIDNVSLTGKARIMSSDRLKQKLTDLPRHLYKQKRKK